jgi:cytochrome c oxidase assembly protein subunit 15
MNASSAPEMRTADVWLGRYAKLVVAMTFALIVVGGHTTTAGAGMAFPDWPLSAGSLNPDGWWQDVMMRLEHSHRAIAGATGVFIGILCAWVWRSVFSVPVSLAAGALGGFGAKAGGASAAVTALSGIIVAAVIFGVMLGVAARRDLAVRPAALRWLAFAAFLGVCAQAILGGLRVILDPLGVAASDTSIATTFRILHGCFAQFELCLVVIVAAMLSPIWHRLAPAPRLRGVAWLGWTTAAFIFGQLIVGAALRHMGAGLAIPTWPAASPDGSWLPAVHSTFVNLHFTHTRVGVALVTLLVIALAWRSFGKAAGEVHIVRPAVLLLALLAAQVTLGLCVIWNARPPLLTTLHVVNGAALLAVTVLLAVRAGRAARLAGGHVASQVSAPGLMEATS